MIKTVLIIGATSGIAQAVARLYATQGVKFCLVARGAEKLQMVAADLLARGASAAHVYTLDATNTHRIPDMAAAVWQELEAVDVALIAHGTLPDQERAERDLQYAISEFRINAESVIASLAAIAPRFEQQGSGVIAVIGSVAGDRGRASNYLYGAAKASIHAFASGLRGRLFKSGVHVLVIKPGFVATAMTSKLDLPEKLTASPEEVAQSIQKAIEQRKDVLYTPWFWTWIMRIIRWMPEVVFKRMQF